jgi:signal transduction histidine kinase
LQTLTAAIKEYLNDCLNNLQNGKNLTAKEKELLEITQEMDTLIESMLMGVDRTSAIIRSLKIFSYAGSGMKERVDIHEGLDATIIMLQHLIKNRIEVYKSYGRLPMVLCNSSQINQVFMNILTNAIDAIPDRGEISIKTLYDSEDNHVVIVVSDTGTGIPDVLNKRVYEPFFTTKEAGKGTGLGLSISYNIVKEHNGELFFDSTPGSGTTFYIELPVE